MARHELAIKLDQTAKHAMDLVDPLAERRFLGRPLPDEVGNFSVNAFIGALGGIVSNPAAAGNVSGRLGRGALVEWALAARPSPETEAPKVPVGHLAVRRTIAYSDPAYSVVLARSQQPGAPALRVEVVMSGEMQPVVTERGPVIHELVKSAQVNFGRLAADGGVRGVFVPFTARNVNHGSELGDIPGYKNPQGMLALLGEVDLVLGSVAQQLAHPPEDL